MKLANTRQQQLNWPRKETAMSSADRPYRCSVCRQSFHSHPRLKDHYREHQQPRQCQNCGKAAAGSRVSPVLILSSPNNLDASLEFLLLCVGKRMIELPRGFQLTMAIDEGIGDD